MDSKCLDANAGRGMFLHCICSSAACKRAEQYTNDMKVHSSQVIDASILEEICLFAEHGLQQYQKASHEELCLPVNKAHQYHVAQAKSFGRQPVNGRTANIGTLQE